MLEILTLFILIIILVFSYNLKYNKKLSTEDEGAIIIGILLYTFMFISLVLGIITNYL